MSVAKLQSGMWYHSTLTGLSVCRRGRSFLSVDTMWAHPYDADDKRPVPFMQQYSLLLPAYIMVD